VKYCIFGEIYGNAPATKAVIENEKENVDEFICTGNILGYGFNEETVRTIQKHCKQIVIGSTDIEITARQMSIEDRRKNTQIPCRTTIESRSKPKKDITSALIEWIYQQDSIKKYDNGQVIVSHAEPFPTRATGLERENTGLAEEAYPELAAIYDKTRPNIDAVLLGHSKKQIGARYKSADSSVCVVNGGAITKFDADGSTLPERAEASYAVVDTAKSTYDLRSVSYSTEELPPCYRKQVALVEKDRYEDVSYQTNLQFTTKT
jgi:hypothetical protein